MIYNEDLLAEEIGRSQFNDVMYMIIDALEDDNFDKAYFIIGQLYIVGRIPNLSEDFKGEKEILTIANKISKQISRKEVEMPTRCREYLEGVQNYLAINSKIPFSMTISSNNITKSSKFRIGQIIKRANISDEEKNKILKDIYFENKSGILLRDLFAINNDKEKLKMIRALNNIDNEDKRSSYRFRNEGNYNYRDLRYITERLAMSFDDYKFFKMLPEDLMDKQKYPLLPIVESLVKNMSDVKNRNSIIEYMSKSNNMIHILDHVEWKSDEEKLNVIYDLPLHSFDYDLMYNRSLVGSFATTIMRKIKNDELLDQVPKGKTNFFYNSGIKYCKGLRKFKNKQKILIKDDKDIIDLDIPKGMTVGVEIETLGDCSYLLNKKSDTFPNWESKEETSIGSYDYDESRMHELGSEVTSPILKGTKEESKTLKDILESLKEMGQEVNEKCAGHIHVNADYFSSAQSIVNLYEIVGNCEKELFLMCNKTHELPREEGPSYYSKMFSGYIADDLKRGGRRIPKHLKGKKLILQSLSRVHNGGRYVSLNSMNAAEEYVNKNTIEFRMPNGTLDYETWCLNIKLMSKIAQRSEELGRLENNINRGKLSVERLASHEIDLISKEEKLKDENLSSDKKAKVLLDLLFDDTNSKDKELKEIFLNRYKVNKKLLDITPHNKNPFEYDTNHNKEYSKIELQSNFNLKKHFDKLFKNRKQIINIYEAEKDMINDAAEMEINKAHRNKENMKYEEIGPSKKGTPDKLNQYKRNTRKNENKHIDINKDNNYRSRLEEGR